MTTTARKARTYRKRVFLSVMDTVTGAVVTWTDGVIAPGADQAGRDMEAAARRLDGERLSDPAWTEDRTGALGEEADPVDVLATLCAATDGHWSILEAPTAVLDSLLGAEEEPADDGLVWVGATGGLS